MMQSVRTSPKLWMVTIYLFLVSGLLYIQPSLAFDEEGRIRPFGTRKKTSTVFPLWLWVIGLAVVSYLLVHVILERVSFLE
jgi:hypothetical protein